MTTPSKIWDLRRDGLAGLGLVLAVFLVYGQTSGFAFINYDDSSYVSKNFQVQLGLTAQSVAWAFTSGQHANWHPLTWLSHMTDWELFGDWAGGHHLMSVSLHALTSALLYFLMVRLTGWRWPSFLVAGLFALHPLHVESVAWVAERKDVLSAMLMVLTLWSYVRYTEQRSWRRYTAVFVLLALGLMAKPMLVTVPFVLLLLDYWPLGRMRLFGPPPKPPAQTPAPAQSPPAPAAKKKGQASAGATQKSSMPAKPPLTRTFPQLVIEKWPLFALAAASCITTFLVQRAGGAVGALEVFPLANRIQNALVAVGAYLWHTLWPQQLAVFYPYNRDLPAWQIGLAALVIVAVTALSLKNLRPQPYLLVGWLWYLGTLVPVIGLVQVGGQAMADRYTYIPLIGIFIMIAGLVSELLSRRPAAWFAVLGLGAAVLVACAVQAHVQVGYWKNTITLFEHTVAVTSDNYVAHGTLGAELEDEGRLAEARAHYLEALRIEPLYADAHNNYGQMIARGGDLAGAIGHFREALRIKADHGDAHNNLGTALIRLGQEPAKAVGHLRRAAELLPDNPQVLAAAAWALSTATDAQLRDGPKALALARRAVLLTKGRSTAALGALAAALAEVGEFDQAAEVCRQAVEVARESGAVRDVQRYETRRQLYRNREHYREPIGGRAR